jgi:hypothetical protein
MALQVIEFDYVPTKRGLAGLGETQLSVNMIVANFWKPAVVIGGILLLVRHGSKRRAAKKRNGLGFVPTNGLGDFGIFTVGLLGGGAYLLTKFLGAGSSSDVGNGAGAGGTNQQGQQGSGAGGGAGSGSNPTSGLPLDPAKTAAGLLAGGGAAVAAGTAAGAAVGGAAGAVIGHAISINVFGTANVPVATTVNTIIGGAGGAVIGGAAGAATVSGGAAAGAAAAASTLGIVIAPALAVMWGASLGLAIWAQETGNTLTDQMDKAREARYSGKPWTPDASKMPAQRFSRKQAFAYDVAQVAQALKDGTSGPDVIAYDIADPKYSQRGIVYPSDAMLSVNSDNGVSIRNPYAKKDAAGNLIGAIINIDNNGNITLANMSAKLLAAIKKNNDLVNKHASARADASGQIYGGLSVNAFGVATGTLASGDASRQRIATYDASGTRVSANPYGTAGQDFGKADQSRRTGESRLAARDGGDGLDGLRVFNLGRAVEFA